MFDIRNTLIWVFFRISLLSCLVVPDRKTVSKIFNKYARGENKEKIKEYAVVPCHKFRCTTKNIFADASYGFILEKNSRPVASIWFDFAPRGIVFVKQIQGVWGTDLTLFRWERMLLRLVVEWARIFKFREVRVIASTRQEFFNRQKTDR